MSMSKRPTSAPVEAREKASCAEKVLLPTPPLPERMRMMCLTEERRWAMAARSGSGPLGAVAQASWLGQPWQASVLPACSLSVPGQSVD